VIPRRSGWRIAGIVLGGVFAAIAARGAEPIKVGEFESLTGREGGFGQPSRQGYALAAEVINANGGVLGRPIELIVEDTQSKSGESATAARKLIARDKVIALMAGGTSSNALEAGPIAEAAHVPLIGAVTTNPKVTALGKYMFRACFADAYQAAVLAKFARESLHAKRVAILTAVSSSYSVGLANEFRGRFIAGGGAIIGEQKYNEGEKDFRAQLTALKAMSPDVIFLPGYFSEVALICHQAHSLGITTPILGGDGWESPELLALAGHAADGCYYSTHFSAEDTAPHVQEFVQRFRAKYGGTAPSAASALCYDSLMMLAAAIQRAGTTDGAKVRDALAATKDFPGVTGRTSIDAQRDANKPAVILVVRDAHSRFFQYASP
jgi:branched-chain amino acid transport system substrate-binding protein